MAFNPVAIFMKSIVTTSFWVLFSWACSGQDTSYDRTLSRQDSMLLSNFWAEFAYAIRAADKDKLAALCEFPFYCRPCIDYTALKDCDLVTVKVSRKMLLESQYRLFFDKPIRAVVEKHPIFENIFYPAYDDKNKRDGFMFFYTRIAPSVRGEGSQGFIFLRNIGGKYEITGLDLVP
jgi:hypothetical protein